MFRDKPVVALPESRGTPRASGLSVPDEPAPIKKVKAFLKRVGRPRIHPDRKVYMKEYMRRWRAKDNKAT